jgi:opacity protein-like surface antigen
MLCPQPTDNKRTKPHQPGAIALAAMVLCSSGAGAAETDQQMFSFAGYGSVGVVHSNESRADFPGLSKHPNGAGYSRSWSNDVDTRFGAQMDAHITDRLSAVVQIVAEQQWDNTYLPKVEWANFKYAFTPDFSIRAGRTALPTFLFADSRKVGYTAPWVRPPSEVYDRLATTNNDGLDTTYRFHIGKVSNSVTAFVGKTRLKFPAEELPGSLLDARHMAGVVDTVKYGDLKLQASYMRATLDIPGLAAIPVPVISSGSSNLHIRIKQVGAMYDPGQWFVMSEWVKTPMDLFGTRYGWYATAGLRIDAFSPYVTYARQGQDAAPVAPLRPLGDQKTAAVGLRWDAKDNVDVKFQYEHLDLDANSSGSLIPKPGFRPGGSAGVFSAVVDFTF